MASNRGVMERFVHFPHHFTGKFEPYIREHLAKVYLLLGSSVTLTAVGASLQILNLLDMGLLGAIISILLVLGLYFYTDDGKNYKIRLGMLLSFCFLSGQTIGPLITHMMTANIMIIILALAGVMVTFFSLTITALLAERNQFLFLGGLLASVVNTMFIVGFLNTFFHVYYIQVAQLYIGVIAMAAFILYDTQNIIEKCRCGNRDVVQHTMDLYFDGLSLFRRLLIMFGEREERRREQMFKRH